MPKNTTLTDNARLLMQKRYCRKNETPFDVFLRVAKAIGENDTERNDFLGMMSRLDFLPNSPMLANAGTPNGQLAACFVLPIEDSMESIFGTLRDTALIHKSGGGTGFSFSNIRPVNDIVSSTGGIASGPVSFMGPYDAVTETVKQGGMRRGANMAVLRCDHPDIIQFIQCKRELAKLNNFNLSVSLTDKFWETYNNYFYNRFIDINKKDTSFALINPRNKEIVGSIPVDVLFNELVRSSWMTGEPGVIFIDEINRFNPHPLLREIEATNPCSEQPLRPYESCVLGSINISNFRDHNPKRPEMIDWDKLDNTVRNAVRLLDNAIDVSSYPLEDIAGETRLTRKIGLGIMGWADFLIDCGIPYDSDDGRESGESIMEFIYEIADLESQKLGKEKGEWASGFYGGNRRNCTLLSIAPTGSISIIANCSPSIEPLFDTKFTRHVLGGEELIEENPHIHDRPPEVMKTAHELKPEDHVKMQAAFQKVVDAGVSKTVNLPHNADETDVADIIRLAHELKCKGITVYRDGCRPNQVLRSNTIKSRPAQVAGITKKIDTGCGKLYITVNRSEEGICEVFATGELARHQWKSDCTVNTHLPSICRIISKSLQHGLPLEEVIKQLEKASCIAKCWGENGDVILSCEYAIAKVLKEQAHMPGDSSVREEEEEEHGQDG